MIYMVIKCLNFLKWINHKDFDLNKYTGNSSKRFVLEIGPQYPKNTQIHNHSPLASNKIEIKEKMLSRYQLMIANFHNIPIGNFKRLVPSFFDKEK